MAQKNVLMTIAQSNLINCQCGCGNLLEKFDSKNRSRKFIHGHHSKESATGLTLWKKFIVKVDVDPISKCWNWIGAKQRYGYGTIIHKGKTIKAHRLSYEKFIGDIPDSNQSKHGTCICHTCDNPSCVNPEHLFAGTQKENIHDMLNKNGHPNSLPSDITTKIKQMLLSGIKVCQIAKSFNIHRTTVSRIKKIL